MAFDRIGSKLTNSTSFDIKNIVVDLDGTLLRSDKTISEKSRMVLRHLIASGKRVIIATARAPRTVYGMLPPEWHELEIIFYNGALIHRNKESIFENYIDTETAMTIQQILEAYRERVVFGFEQDDWLYSNGSFGQHWPSSFYTEIDLGTFSIAKPAKVLVNLHSQDIVDYLRAHLPQGCRLMVTDRNSLGQIMRQGVSKYAALLTLMSEVAEVTQQTMCFGDDVNDVDVFQHCACSVAMENAVEEVRSLANHIAKNNDQDGVACFLSDYFSISEQSDRLQGFEQL